MQQCRFVFTSYSSLVRWFDYYNHRLYSRAADLRVLIIIAYRAFGDDLALSSDTALVVCGLHSLMQESLAISNWPSSILSEHVIDKPFCSKVLKRQKSYV